MWTTWYKYYLSIQFNIYTILTKHTDYGFNSKLTHFELIYNVFSYYHTKLLQLMFSCIMILSS